MKPKYLFIFTILFGLVSCNNRNKEADAYGNFETTEVMVAAEVPGKLIKFDVDEGIILKKGQLVATVDTQSFSMQLQQLIAQHELLKTKFIQNEAQKEVYLTQKENIERDKKRIMKMFEEGAATQKQLDDVNGQLQITIKQIELVEAQYKSVKEEVSSINKQIELANYQLEKCYIKNPIDGTVLDKYIEISEITGAGKNLYKIANLNKLYLRAYVSENQLSQFKIGDTVNVMVDNNKDKLSEYKGVISWVSTTAEFTPKIVQTKEERVNLVYAIKVLVNNNGSIKIGMPGEVKFN